MTVELLVLKKVFSWLSLGPDTETEHSLEGANGDQNGFYLHDDRLQNCFQVQGSLRLSENTGWMKNNAENASELIGDTAKDKPPHIHFKQQEMEPHKTVQWSEVISCSHASQ